jgi:uncharacterized membrane protein YdbT with pleckstrin-like domain
MEENRFLDDEKTICEVSPSQILNLKAFLISLVLAAAIIVTAIYSGVNEIYYLLAIPVLYALWKWIELRTTKLKVTDQRIILRQGVFSKTTNETELYRVRDSKIDEPFFYRVFGCGNIHIFTTDEAEAKLLFQGYKKPHWLKDQIRNFAEICRQKKRWGADNVLLHDHTSNPSEGV